MFLTADFTGCKVTCLFFYHAEWRPSGSRPLATCMCMTGGVVMHMICLRHIQHLFMLWRVGPITGWKTGSDIEEGFMQMLLRKERLHKNKQKTGWFGGSWWWVKLLVVRVDIPQWRWLWQISELQRVFLRGGRRHSALVLSSGIGRYCSRHTHNILTASLSTVRRYS